MPKDFLAPSQQWNVQDQINQSKIYNQQDNKSLDDYKLKTEALKKLGQNLDTLELNGVDVTGDRKYFDIKSKELELGFGEKLGVVGRNIGNDYVGSFAKAFGGNPTSYSQKMDEAKQKREEVINPISTIATEVALDPLTYAPLNFASKGTAAVRAGKDFAKGAGLNAGTYTAKEYDSENFKPEDALIAGVFGGGINAGIGKFLSRGVKGDLLNPDVTNAYNITDRILSEGGTPYTKDAKLSEYIKSKLPTDKVVEDSNPAINETVQQNTIKSDNNTPDSIAKKMNDMYFGGKNIIPDAAPVRSDMPVIDNQQASKVNDFFNPVDKNRIQAQGDGSLPTPASQQDPFIYQPKQADTFGWGKDAQRNNEIQQLREKIAPLNDTLKTNETNSLMGVKRENPNDINLPPMGTQKQMLPDVLPLDNKEEMKSIIRYAKDNNAVDEFISKLPPNKRVDEVQKFFDNLKPAQSNQDGIVQVRTNIKEPIKTYDSNALNEFEGLTKATGMNTSDVLSLEKPTSTAGVRNSIIRYEQGTATQRDFEILDAVDNFMKYEGDNFRSKVNQPRYKPNTTIDDAVSNNMDYETANRMGAIPFSNGSQTFGGAAVGGTESEFNQRDYNNDGKHDYKDNLIGALIGAVGVSAARKIMPNAFKDKNIDSNTAGMFVGAKPSEHGAFSDVATKKVIKEIDDTPSLTKSGNWGTSEDMRYGNTTTAKLGEVFSHDELFKKYPDLKDVNVGLIPDKKGASWDLENNRITVGYDKKIGIDKSNLLHEIQHNIQDKEGWAKGGNIDNVIPRIKQLEINKLETLLNEVKNEAKQVFTFDDIIRLKREGNQSLLNEKRLQAKELSNIADKYEEKLNKLKKDNNPFDLYQSLHGEQQARATQQRMNYTPEQRASEDWTQTLAKNEGKYNEPIIKYDGGVAESVDKNVDEIKRDENFKKWFGGSKVVDAKGEPLVVYHGTNANFNNFSKDKIGSNFNADRNGFFFTEDANLATLYAGKEKGSSIIPTYLDIKNPFIIDAKNQGSIKAFDTNRTKHIEEALSKGHDGIIVKSSRKKDNMYVVFEPTQIKSVNNKGTFSKVDPNILNSSPTLSGGMVGGITGANNDLNGDGKTDLKDILMGVGLGAGGTKGVMLARNNQKFVKVVEDVKSNQNVNAIYGFNIKNSKDYLQLRENVMKVTNQKMEQFSLLHEQLKLLPEKDKKAMYEYMSGNKGVQLDKDTKQLADNYTNEISKMGKELVDLGVLEEAQFDKFDGRYLHRRYEKDFSQKFNSLFTKGKTIQGVHARGNEWNGTKTEYEKLLNEGKIGDFFDGKIEAVKTGKGQYKFRQDWTEEQRTRWGEVKDIAFSLPETLMRTSEMVNHAKFLKEVIDKTEYVADESMQGYSQLVGKRYGALQGKYVRNDIAQDIGEFNKALFGKQSDAFTDNFAEGFKATLTYWKKTHTVYNGAAHFNNLISNVLLQFGAGINPHKAVANAKRGYTASGKIGMMRELEAKKLIGLNKEEIDKLNILANDEDVILWKQAKEAGIFGRSRLNDVLNKYVIPTSSSGSFSKMGGLKKIDEKLSNMYQGEDDIMRFSVLKSLTDKGMSFDAAAKKVSEIIPDYTQPMSWLARKARDTGVIPFVSWTYHATPILINQIKENPERILAVYGALYGINKLAGIDPFNEKDIPQENFAMKRIPIYKNGNEITTIKVDRWTPHNDLFSPVDFIKNLLSPGIYTPLLELPRNQNLYFGGKLTHKEGAGKYYDFAKYTASQFTPDVIDNVGGLIESKLLSKEKRTKNPVIQPRTTLQEIFNTLGINSMTYNKANQAREVEKQKLNKLKKDKGD